MRKRVLPVLFVPIAGLLYVAGPAAAAAPPSSSDCVITEVSSVTGVDPSGNERLNGVATTIEGAVPPDVGRTVTEAVTQAMAATEPVRTAVQPVSDGVVVTVRDVAGDIPAALPADLERATGCALDSAASLSADNGDSPASESAASRECAVTSVLPVDATGTVTSAVTEVQGVVIGVTGPLPVDLAATVAGVLHEIGAAASDAVAQVVDTVAGAQVTVQGVTGPLPVDLSGQLAAALGCHDTAAPPAFDGGSGTPASGEVGGGGSGSGNISVKGSSVSSSGSAKGNVSSSSSLPFTGMNVLTLTAAGSALAGVGFALMRLRRPVP
jgi:hypothetical protein